MFEHTRQPLRIWINTRAFGLQTLRFADVVRRHTTGTITFDHRQRATYEVAKPARQIAICARDQSLITEIAILPEDHLAQQEIAHRVNAKLPAQQIDVNRIAECLRQLARRLINPSAMRNDCGRLLYACGHQERGPVDRMLAQYVFANEMERGASVI